MLEKLHAEKGIAYKVIAIDPLESRRAKMQQVLTAIGAGQQNGECVVEDIEGAKELVGLWTDSIGCNAVLEVGNHVLHSNVLY